MATFNHSPNYLGDSFCLVNVFPNLRISFSNVILIVSPSCHHMSPLSSDPIVAFGFGFFYFSAWRLLCFLSELMQEDVGVIFVVEVQDSIIPWPKLPYIVFQMLCDALAQPGTMIL